VTDIGFSLNYQYGKESNYSDIAMQQDGAAVFKGKTFNAVVAKVGSIIIFFRLSW
jgi:hypothetical protein